MERLDQLRLWLHGVLPGEEFELRPASADASFRSYFRLHAADGPTRIIMDAPPDQEDCRPWLDVAKLFCGAGVHVPQVIAEDTRQGFILMSDLGSTTYLQALSADNAANLYADALGSLIAIQRCSAPGHLPEYSHEMLMREMLLFEQWYVGRHLGQTLDAAQRAALATVLEQVAAVNLAEPKVFVHRDYHSRNLMHVPEGGNPGIIDFQDAVYGPVTYDLVSLLKDAYVSWEEDFTLDQLARYWDAARKLGVPVRQDFSEFHRDYEWMGVQRHLKVLGIFARLSHRDGKDNYLDDLPLVFEYLHRTCQRYRELRPLLKLLDKLQPRTTSAGFTF